MRDWPRSAGFSSTSTRRSASSVVSSRPASSTSGLTSSKRQIAGTHWVTGCLVTRYFSTSHSGVMSRWEMRS